jgi:hypothetical protein
MRNLLRITLLALALTACGGDGGTTPTTTVKADPTPEDAVAAAKLKWAQFRGYYYCELAYPRVCDDLPVAYVLPREGSDPMRIVYFNNQDRASTWAIFDYATWDPDTGDLALVGHFQWRAFAGSLDRQGQPMWGIPE